MRAPEPRSGFLEVLWFVLLLATLLFAPWLGGQMEGVGPAVARALAAATALAWLMERRGRVDAPLPVVLFWVFVAWCALTVSVSEYLHGSLTTLGDYVSWGGLALVAHDAGRDGKKRFAVAAALLLSLAVVGGFGVYDGYTNVAGWRVFGPFATPNLYACYLITLLPLALLATLREPRDLSPDASRGLSSVVVAVVSVLPFGLGLTALLMTGSKGAVLALAVAVGLAAVAVCSWRRVYALGVCLAVAMAFFAVLTGGKVLVGRVGSATTGEAHSGEFRRLTWEGTARMAAAHPVVGTGVGSFGANFGQYAIAGWTAAAHNAYLQTAAETGMPGVVLLVVALGTAAWVLRRQALSDDPQTSLVAASALAGLLAAAAHNLVDYGWAIWAPGAVLWAMVGLGLSKAKPLPWPRWAACLCGVALAGTLVSGVLTANAQSRADSILVSAALSPSEAASELAAARRLDPLDGKLAVSEARAWRAAGNLEKAEAALRDAVHLNPGDATAWRNLAELELQQDDLEQAASTYRKGLARSPQAMKLLAGLARTEEAAGHTRESLEHWRVLARIAEGPVGRYPAIPQIVDVEPMEAYAALAKASARAGYASSAHTYLARLREQHARYERNRREYPVQWQAVNRGSDDEAARVRALLTDTEAAVRSTKSP